MATKKSRPSKISNKRKSSIKNVTEEQKLATNIQRIFLYLQPEIIVYQIDDEDINVEIHLKHAKNTITKLDDHYSMDNVINVNRFETEKPTFSITLEQDNIEDINKFADYHLVLTLYERKILRPVMIDEGEYEEISSENEAIPDEASIIEIQSVAETIIADGPKIAETNIGDQQKKVAKSAIDKPTISKTIIGDGPEGSHGSRTTIKSLANMEEFISEEENWKPVAQGYIDLLEFFSKKRTQCQIRTFLYPIMREDTTPACKMIWNIYTLLPLLKNITITNVLFLTLASLHNLEEELINDCDDMLVRLSFLSKNVNEQDTAEFSKVHICNFTALKNTIIAEQSLVNKWETLKDNSLNNLNSLCINSENNIDYHNLFKNLHSAQEHAEFEIDSIQLNDDCALICNSMHRLVLTQELQNEMEAALCSTRHKLLVEILRERDPNKVLLEGLIDLSIFLYPKVSAVPFVFQLRSTEPAPPVAVTTVQTPKSTKRSLKSKGKVRKSRDSNASSTITAQQSALTVEKIPFGIFKLSLSLPITDPREDIMNLSEKYLKHDNYKFSELSNVSEPKAYEQTELKEMYYKQFDDYVKDLFEYMVQNNIQNLDKENDFFHAQVGHMNNRLMKLIAIDFNQREPTKTNAEFKNLMPLVYQELFQRIYNFHKKCKAKRLDDCVHDPNAVQNVLTTRFDTIKHLNEIGDKESAQFFLSNLRKEFPNCPKFNFYLFLYNIEMDEYEEADKYLKLPLSEKDDYGSIFLDLIIMYINYRKQMKNPNDAAIQAIELLIHELTNFCEYSSPLLEIGVVLLYCLYKKHNYLPGIEYARWKYQKYSYNFPEVENIPQPKWLIFLPYSLEPKSRKGIYFNKIMKFLLSLGLYEFALWIYEELEEECLEVEKYMMATTFGLVLKTLNVKEWKINTFANERFHNEHLRACISQVNGNVEYHKDPTNAASVKLYSQINKIDNLKEQLHLYKLSLLRSGYRQLIEKEYEKAIQSFALCRNESARCIIADIGMGKSYYHMGQLNEAVQYFSLSTEYGIHLIYVWAYLALINLRLGDNHKALECWKYARLNITEEIPKEILIELEKIDYSEVSLFVDINDQANVCSIEKT